MGWMAESTIALLAGVLFGSCSAVRDGARGLDKNRPLRVVLDVGHFPRGDSVPLKGQGMLSARGVGEFELNRKAVLALAKTLGDSAGLEVVVHNLDGSERALRTRTRRAHELGADLFLSIHHDAVDSSEASRWIHGGSERLYCDSVSGFSLWVHDSTVGYSSALALARLIGHSLVDGGRRPNLHHARPEERALGREVLDSALGVYRNNLAVLVSAKMPAILIECGVASNRDEELVLDSDSGRAEFARLVARGVKNWMRADSTGIRQGNRPKSARAP